MPESVTSHRQTFKREAVIALVLALSLGGLLVLMGDLSVKAMAISIAGLIGLGVFLVLPNKRIMLVCGWVLVLPLSLEKIFFIFSPWREKFLTPPLVVSGADIVFLLLIGYLVFENVVRRRKTFFWPKVATPFVLLACWALLLFIFMDKPAPAKMQVIHWAKMVAFVLVMPSCIRSRGEIMMVLVSVLVALSLQVAVIGATDVTKKRIGFSSNVGGGAPMQFSAGEGYEYVRLSGTVGHVNQQAMFHTFFTLPLIGLFGVRNQLVRVGAFFVVAASMAGLVLTFSRTGWIACAIAGLLILAVALRNGRIGKEIWLVLGGGAVLGAVLLAFFGHAIVDRIFKGDEGASSSRLRMASLALENTATNPLCGVGPGNFIEAKLVRTEYAWVLPNWVELGKSYTPSLVGGLDLYEVEVDGKWYFFPGTVHNKFLLTLSELGLVGLVIFLWFEWRLFRCALRCLQARDSFLWWTALGMLAMFCALQIFFMLELFYDDKTVLMYLFPLTLLIALDRIVSRETEARLA